MDFFPRSHQLHYRIHEPKPGYQLTVFERAPLSIQTPFEEAVRASRLIYETYQIPLTICLSGGLDSECLAQAVLASGVPFNIVTLRLKPEFNAHDTVHAESFCRQYQLPIRFLDLDIIRFYESGEFLEYALKYRTNSPQFAAHLWLADHAEGVPVFGGSFPYLNYFDFEGNLLEESFLYTPEDKEYGVDRLFQKQNRPGVGHFFQYTPELYFSFLCKTVAGGSLAQRQKLKLGSYYQFKTEVFSQAGFNMQLTPERQDKYTGFEKVKAYYAERYGIGDVYEKLFRLPLQKMFPVKTSVRTLFPKEAGGKFYSVVGGN